MSDQSLAALEIANRAKAAKTRLRADLLGLDRRQALGVAAAILEDDYECTSGLLAGLAAGQMLCWIDGTAKAQAAELCGLAGTDATRKLREITPGRRARLAKVLRLGPPARRLPADWKWQAAA